MERFLGKTLLYYRAPPLSITRRPLLAQFPGLTPSLTGHVLVFLKAVLGSSGLCHIPLVSLAFSPNSPELSRVFLRSSVLSWRLWGLSYALLGSLGLSRTRLGSPRILSGSPELSSTILAPPQTLQGNHDLAWVRLDIAWVPLNSPGAS